MSNLHLTTFFVALFSASPSFSQSDFSSLTVILTDYAKEPIPGESFTLFVGEDLVVTRTTDENGEFRIDSLLLDTEYTLFDNSSSATYYSEPLKLITDPFQQDYIVTLSHTASKYRQEHSPSVIYFEQNQVEPVENFEAEFIRELLKEHPELCLEFSQAIGYDESEEILQARKDNFLKHLEETKVDITRIRFSDKVHILSDAFEDRRSRIEGAVYSMDSECK